MVNSAILNMGIDALAEGLTTEDKIKQQEFAEKIMPILDCSSSGSNWESSSEGEGDGSGSEGDVESSEGEIH